MSGRNRRIVSLWQARKLCEATLSRAEDLFDRLMSRPKEPERKGNGTYFEKGKDSGKGKSAGAGKDAGKGKGKTLEKGSRRRTVTSAKRRQVTTTRRASATSVAGLATSLQTVSGVHD